MFNDIMIDIETTGNTHDAVMIQLGVCAFDRKTGKILKSDSWNITQQSCKDLGFVENQDTLDWWAKQNQEIWMYITTQDLEHIQIVMEKFFAGYIHKNTKIWSHATFDFPIVQNYLKKLNIGYMPYKGARDIRTLVDLSGIDLNSYDWNQKTHDALDDCIFQVKYCVDAMKLLGGEEPEPTQNQKDIAFLLKQANKNPNLNQWEMEFVESIEDQVANFKTLSPKQEETLHRVAMK